MVIAIGVTICHARRRATPWLIVGGIVIGGAVGTFIALRIQMTALPQLVAAFHSLVGLAAVLRRGGRVLLARRLRHRRGRRDQAPSSLIEMGLGTAIGAITFTGSIIAFAKLQGLMSGAPLVFPGQHPLNALLGVCPAAPARLVRHARPSRHLRSG